MSEGTRGWIGVDLDGTLAHYDGFRGPEAIGHPIPRMLARVRRWLEQGIEVRVFTARVWHDGSPRLRDDAGRAEAAVREWCVEHLGRALQVTCQKDYNMVQLWDDRAVHVLCNTGICVPADPMEEEGGK